MTVQAAVSAASMLAMAKAQEGFYPLSPSQNILVQAPVDMRQQVSNCKCFPHSQAAAEALLLQDHFVLTNVQHLTLPKVMLKPMSRTVKPLVIEDVIFEVIEDVRIGV